MAPDGSLVFSDFSTGTVFRFKSSTDVQPLVEENKAFRYADFYPVDSNYVLAVKEDHTNPLPKDVVNTVILIDGKNKTTTTVLEGADFYSHPKFSPDGKWLSWIQWNHPDMPWTGTELYIAEWTHGKIGKPRLVAGKAVTEAAGQPKWHSYGGLMFTSDKTGYYQLYMFDPSSFEVRKVEVKGFEDADLGGKDGLGK